MPVRVGVDVGGTFTKAVACEASSGEIVARAVVPTTHTAISGVAEGVLEAVGRVIREVEESRLGPPLLVAHSTTQAVNALLEGDTAIVGVLGLGRRPDIRRARRRTQVGEVKLAPARKLLTRHRFLDVTGGLRREELKRAIRDLVDAGAEVLCVSEAFGVEDARGEWLALEEAEQLGLLACAGHELTGLYGLEMRTVTAALNASILPAAVRTARLVEEAIARDVPGLPLLVMRGDGGAADMSAMKRHPLLTAFSGPAASVAGSLRHLSVHDGIVVEVGGTSTNVSAINGGRPILDYVRVLDHVTCVRSLDVRVVGVAGGSLLSVGRRLGRLRLADIGPRSAHIAGLRYCSFADPGELESCRPVLIAPRPGDPESYVAMESRDGRRYAPTLTCAANALGTVPRESYASGNARSARLAFELLSEWLGEDVDGLARRAVSLAAGKVAAVVSVTAREHELEHPTIVGLGGGAGALVPALAAAMGSGWEIPQDAEIISSVGDALSLVRVEIERTLRRPSIESVAQVHREAETAAVAAGASPDTLQVESSAVPERGALRVAAVGALALTSAAASRHLDDASLEKMAQAELQGPVESSGSSGHYAVFTSGEGSERQFAVIDRLGSVAASGRGTVVRGPGREVAASLEQRLPAFVRHYGPIAVAPALRILRDSRLVDLSLFSSPEAALEAARSECSLAGDGGVIVIVSRG